MNDEPEFMRGRGTKPAPQKADTEDEIDLGPCVSRVSVKTFPGFQLRGVKTIRKGDKPERGLRVINYSHVGFFGMSEDNKALVLEANEPEKWKITIYGTNLMKLVSGLNRNLIEWIEPQPGNSAKFRTDGEHVFIEDMTIQRIEDKD